MLDKFREDANASPYFKDESGEIFEEVKPPRHRERIFGMTAAQRLVVSLMLLMMTCIVGGLMLLVFEKVALPFF
jgi:hypothetical protein